MSEYSTLEAVLHARTFKDRVTLGHREYETLSPVIQEDYQYVGDGHFREKEAVYQARLKNWAYEREHWDDWLYGEE